MIAGISIVLLRFVCSIAASLPIGCGREKCRALGAHLPLTLGGDRRQFFRYGTLRANEDLRAKSSQRQEQGHSEKEWKIREMLYDIAASLNACATRAGSQPSR